MALDGIFLRHIKKELEKSILNSRIDKIYQPNKEELLFCMKSIKSTNKLLISTRANSARIHLTNYTIENPKVPPMYCMLLRKKLSGAKLKEIKQVELDRVLYLIFDTVNELGDREELNLIIEIMGKYSNVILMNSENIIIDALKRVNIEMSSKRLILPGIKYSLPPKQNKLCILKEKKEKILEETKNKKLLDTIQGVSPIVCKEIENKNKSLEDLIDIAKNISGSPFVVKDKNNNPIDFTFWKCGDSYYSIESFSKLLDDFYYTKDKINRMKVKSQDLLKKLNNIYDKLNRKIKIQKKELLDSEDREKFKIYADLINVNLYKIKKGQITIELENFYEEDNPEIKIELNPMLNAAQNAQRYYKKYRKLKIAEENLKEQITKAIEEKKYIETVLDFLSRSETESDLNDIKEELLSEGYIKLKKKNNKKAQEKSKPLEFKSRDDFKILVGKNNKQNDKLTMKIAKKNDLWFHTKGIPGSHVVIVSDCREISENAINEAAMLAAENSKAKNSENVPVDYTKIRNVSKQNGSKPGMVVYVKQKTIYVTPKN